MTTDATGDRSDRRERRDVTINVRASAGVRDLIDRAAAAIGKTRSDFMLETARARAEDVLLDRALFALDDRRFRAFAKRLDEPPPPAERLRRLLAEKAPWEKSREMAREKSREKAPEKSWRK